MDEMLRYEVERSEKWRDWCPQIPKLHFKEEWEVKIIPPFGGAIARFTVSYNHKHCSIYLDCYSRLGLVDEPYWEIYCDGECARFFLNEHEEMMEHIQNCLK
jgi:hypothetical protein